MSYFTFGRRKICKLCLAKMGDENASHRSHRMDRRRRPGRAWPALVGCHDVQIGPPAQRGNQLALDAVKADGVSSGARARHKNIQHPPDRFRNFWRAIVGDRSNINPVKAAPIFMATSFEIDEGVHSISVSAEELAPAGAPSLRAIIRKPSCLISCSHSAPEGGFDAFIGRHGGMNPAGRLRGRGSIRR